ncbi:hypothetical protein BCR34DRAFT_625969 [Clohesyomyces aquaticus]|uniref:Zn(2)-C6 fungal-type domain-containing protein n=1 Tax=Clohesyomyces aquaticus TaxID=1231657 RepID=A0A1Y1ZFP4_9PLEO|nr:hypothetical protein BCR34DRAFT_625969 [Clohesyomyces aquaticus]
MATSLVTRKRNVQGRTKVRTGCATCRKRKIKCDESKPSCRKCGDTGRKCDGYESPFRLFTAQPIKDGGASAIDFDTELSSISPALPQTKPWDIDLLNHYFSTKTVFNVKLGCNEEARKVLQASLTDPSIRHALSSLRALRDEFESTGGIPAYVAQQTPSHDHGLRHYCMALKGLASNLSYPHSNGLKSALLCCQIFISIEQVRGNYAAMAQHILQGLKIMREYRARPNFVAGEGLVPAHHEELPFIDVFIIKLFVAPCRFAEAPATADMSGTAISRGVISLQQRSVEPGNLRTIVPDMRTKLTRIATSTLDFLDKVSHLESPGDALRLLSEKAFLLESLESWLIDFETVQPVTGHPNTESISATFQRLFYHILKIVLVGALDPSPDPHVKLRTESDRLWSIVSNLSERVKGYRTRINTGGSQGPSSGVP